MSTAVCFSQSVGKKGFTLAELMVVIAIMTIILVLAVPSFRGLGQGAGMKGAIVELRTTLSLARQWAITHRQKTYIIFPDSGLSYAGIQEQMHKACKAYGVFALTNISGTIKQGYYVKEWTYLPAGVVFDESLTPQTSQTVFQADCLVADMPFPDEGNLRDVYCIVFRPDGTTMRTAGYEAFLQEGWANVSTSGTWKLDYGMITNGARQGVEVVGLTGWVKVHDYRQNY